VPNPIAGSWTSAPQTVNVTSTGATKIYVSAVTTTDGSTPSNPSAPTVSSTVLANGAAGNYTVPSTFGKKSITKVCFAGYNTGGLAISSFYTYTVSLVPAYGSTLTQTQAVANPGTDITAIITKSDGTIDPTAKFYQPSGSTTLLSITDLVTGCLKSVYGDQTFAATVDSYGIMTISANTLGKLVLPEITGSLATTASTVPAVNVTVTGNIVITFDGLAITLYPASANQAAFTSTLQSYGMSVAYGTDHVMQVTTSGTSPIYLSLRFSNFAQKKSAVTATSSEYAEVVESSSTTSNQACIFSVDSSNNVNVTYPDGTLQVMPPYINDPELLKSWMISNNMPFSIDPATGEIKIYNSSTQPIIIWKGLPSYSLTIPPIANVTQNATVMFLPDISGDNVEDMLFTTQLVEQYVYSYQY